MQIILILSHPSFPKRRLPTLLFVVVFPPLRSGVCSVAPLGFFLKLLGAGTCVNYMHLLQFWPLRSRKQCATIRVLNCDVCADPQAYVLLSWYISRVTLVAGTTVIFVSKVSCQHGICSYYAASLVHTLDIIIGLVVFASWRALYCLFFR